MGRVERGGTNCVLCHSLSFWQQLLDKAGSCRLHPWYLCDTQEGANWVWVLRIKLWYGNYLGMLA